MSHEEKGPAILGIPLKWIVLTAVLALVLGTGAWIGLSTLGVGNFATAFGTGFVALGVAGMILFPMYMHYNQPVYEPAPKKIRRRDPNLVDGGEGI